MEGALADKTEESLVRLVAPILSAIDMVTTTGDVQTLESESGGSTLGGAVGEASAEDVEETVFSHGDGVPNGDAILSAIFGASDVSLSAAESAKAAEKASQALPPLWRRIAADFGCFGHRV
ncbi:unnamed protein product [Macrosiphum euphorbiae]|uniref:Uncharacterized protein n=1 Tax=Macrosiphum euphorbiae TaxID=13131 RepID=A0AAV0X2K8_9HEMI|nr:unnamed protein product [Macrosiphum euphorbiae]